MSKGRPRSIVLSMSDQGRRGPYCINVAGELRGVSPILHPVLADADLALRSPDPATDGFVRKERIRSAGRPYWPMTS